MRLRDFTVARIIRLYPLYFLGLMLGIISSLLFAHVVSSPYFSPLNAGLVLIFGVALVPNFVAHWPISYSFPLNAPSWSLFYELVANFVFARLTAFARIRNALLMGICFMSLGGLLLGLSKQVGVSVGAYPDTFLPGFARVGFSFSLGFLCFGYTGISGTQISEEFLVGLRCWPREPGSSSPYSLRFQ